MKKFLYIVIDLMIVYGSILFIFYLLDYNQRLIEFNKNFEAFVKLIPYIGLLYLIFTYVYKLYNTVIYRTISDIIYMILVQSLSIMIGIMGICFFIRDIAFAFPRSVILYSGFVYFIFLTLWHVFIWIMQRKITGVKKATIIGDDYTELSGAITYKLKDIYQIVSQCNLDELSFESEIEKVDTIFLSINIPERTRDKILSICAKEKKELFLVPKYSDLRIMLSNFYKIDDIPAFRLRNIDLSAEQNFVKRVLDLLLCSIALVILFPFCTVVALLIKLDGGTIFYSQERYTRERKIFKILKFRTMIPDAEKVSGPVFAGENDPRITKLGKFMRRTRIDEIPQLINIFKGEMSIVGPRPERPFFVEQFEKENFEYSLRFNVKAGLTGLAQVEGKYNTTMENKLRYDLYYISNYSIWNDLLIIIQTIKVLFMKSSTEGVVDNK